MYVSALKLLAQCYSFSEGLCFFAADGSSETELLLFDMDLDWVLLGVCEKWVWELCVESLRWSVLFCIGIGYLIWHIRSCVGVARWCCFVNDISIGFDRRFFDLDFGCGELLWKSGIVMGICCGNCLWKSVWLGVRIEGCEMSGLWAFVLQSVC